MDTSAEINELAGAFSAMQAEMESAIKDTQAFKYKYSDLAAVWGVLKGPMTKNGLSVTQEAKTLPEGVSVKTRIMHKSGQWIEYGPLIIPVGKMDAHSTGSAITYGKRYALCAALGVVTEDDDGQEAQKNPPKPEAKKVLALTEEEYNVWVDSWEQKGSWALEYNSFDVLNYLDARSEHYGHSIRMTAAEMKKDDKMFEKYFKTWLKQEGEKEKL